MEHCDRERGRDYLPSFFMSRILYNIRDINFHPVVTECADGVSLLVSHEGKNWMKFQLTDCVGRCRLIGIRRSISWHRSLQ